LIYELVSAAESDLPNARSTLLIWQNTPVDFAKAMKYAAVNVKVGTVEANERVTPPELTNEWWKLDQTIAVKIQESDVPLAMPVPPESGAIGYNSVAVYQLKDTWEYTKAAHVSSVLSYCPIKRDVLSLITLTAGALVASQLKRDERIHNREFRSTEKRNTCDRCPTNVDARLCFAQNVSQGKDHEINADMKPLLPVLKNRLRDVLEVDFHPAASAAMRDTAMEALFDVVDIMLGNKSGSPNPTKCEICLAKAAMDDHQTAAIKYCVISQFQVFTPLDELCTPSRAADFFLNGHNIVYVSVGGDSGPSYKELFIHGDIGTGAKIRMAKPGSGHLKEALDEYHAALDTYQLGRVNHIPGNVVEQVFAKYASVQGFEEWEIERARCGDDNSAFRWKSYWNNVWAAYNFVYKKPLHPAWSSACPTPVRYDELVWGSTGF